MERVLRDGAFAGETHIVTGAAQGIGLRVAAALAAHGARVALVDLDRGRLEAARDEIVAGGAGEEPLVVPCNVTDEDDVKRAVASALEAGGRLNGVVNVAGHHARRAHRQEVLRGLQARRRRAPLRHLPLHARDRRAALAAALQGERQRAAARRREPLHRELLVGERAQRQRRADRLHGGEGRDRGRDAHDGARVRELRRARQRDRAGSDRHADAGRRRRSGHQADGRGDADRARRRSPRRWPPSCARSPIRRSSDTRPARSSR